MLQSETLKKWIALRDQIESELEGTAASVVQKTVTHLPFSTGNCPDVPFFPADDWYDYGFSCDVTEERGVLVIAPAWFWGQWKWDTSDCERSYFYRCTLAIANWRGVVNYQTYVDRIETELSTQITL